MKRLKGLATKIETLKEGVKLSVLFPKTMKAEVIGLDEKEVEVYISVEPIEAPVEEGLAEAKGYFDKAVAIMERLTEKYSQEEMKEGIETQTTILDEKTPHSDR
ncbi:MAG: hypothetical protein WC623_24210 [Pedobacter sp.]|uniref:hypothetical protein n=1 Tax=Pedobacter sp. TaxID=1411316 RepID=UPI00356854AA